MAYIRFALVPFALLTLLTACASTVPNRSMLTMMTQLVEAEDSLDRIWPGYAPSTRHYAVYREGRDALLISADSGIEGFEKLDHPGLADKAWYSQTPPNTLRGAFATTTDLGGVSATGVREDRDLVTMIHEDFHAFQSERWGVESESRLDAFNASNAHELAVGLDLESDAILKVWGADEKRRKELLIDYLALRHVRESGMPKKQVQVERHRELIEGTATYVDIRASSILGAHTRERIGSLQHNLRRSNSDTMQMVVRKRSYGVGFMLCVMLDRWAGGLSWKSRVSEENEALSNLLIEALRIDSDELASRGMALRKDYGFERRLEAEKRRPSNLRPAIDLSRYPWQLAFTFITPIDEHENSFTGNVSFSHGGIHELADGWTLVPSPDPYNLQFPRKTLQVSGHPVLYREEKQEGRVRTEFIVLLKGPPDMETGRLSPGEHMLAGQPFRQSGITLDADDPVHVKLERIDALDTSESPWIDLE